MAVVALVLTGCTAAKLQPEQQSSIRRIGIVSLLPTELRYAKIGVTVFNNEFKSYPVGDVLNEAVRISAQRSLQRMPNRSVLQLRDGMAALSASYYSNSLVMSQATERIQAELSQLAKTNGLDAILVVAEVFDGDQGRAGVRVFLRAGVGKIRSASLMPDVVVHVVDKSGGTLATDYARAIGVPARRAGERIWEYPLEANLDDSTRARVLADMERALGDNVAFKMERLGF